MTQTEEFPLERYLAKLITIHTHVNCLVHYAHSPRLHRCFDNKKFSVETAGQPRTSVVMPKPQDWNRVVAEVLELPGLLANPSDKLTSLLTTLGTKYSGTIRAPVHRECALIAHCQNRPKSTSDVVHWGQQVVVQGLRNIL